MNAANGPMQVNVLEINDGWKKIVNLAVKFVCMVI